MKKRRNTINQQETIDQRVEMIIAEAEKNIADIEKLLQEMEAQDEYDIAQEQQSQEEIDRIESLQGPTFEEMIGLSGRFFESRMDHLERLYS